MMETILCKLSSLEIFWLPCSNGEAVWEDYPIFIDILYLFKRLCCLFIELFWTIRRHVTKEVGNRK